MEDFIAITKLIKYTPDYPKPGINFADLTKVLTSASLRRLLRILCDNIGMDRDWVLVGVPTRGCHVALLAAAACGLDPTVIQLQKDGVGTLMPGSEEFCRSGTVYSDDRRSTFLIDGSGTDALRRAHTVIVCDDVIESGKTVSTIVGAIRKINPACRVTALCLMQLLDDDKAAAMGLNVHAVLDKTYSDGVIRPSDTLYRRPTALGVLRGATHIPRFTLDVPNRTAVYGPPSMTDHLIAYVANVNHAFVGDASWKYFAGGCPNFFVRKYDAPCNVVFLYDASTSVETQNYMVRELARICTGAMRIVIPYMPQATMERIDVPGTVATAKHFLDVLCSGLQPVAGGCIDVELIDIHCTGEALYVPSNVRAVLSTVIRKMVRADAHIVAFPDGGAFSRFSKQFRGFTQIAFDKIRDGAKRLITFKTKVGPRDIAGNEVTLVDDLVRTGDTLMKAAHELKARGASRVHVVFAHADLEPGRAHTLATCPDIDSITCSDSCLQKAYALQQIDCHRVRVVSVFGFVQSALSMPVGLAPIAAVASLDDDKNEAAFGFFNREVAGCRSGTRIAGLLSFAVNSRVPEQPVGDDQGVAGAQNRLNDTASLFECFPRIPTVAFESFMRRRADGSYVDTVCAMMLTAGGEVLGPAFVEGAVPPTALVDRAIAEHKVVGEVLMETDNLSSKAAWIDFYSTDGTTRVEQLNRALRQCVPASAIVITGGGR